MKNLDLIRELINHHPDMEVIIRVKNDHVRGSIFSSTDLQIESCLSVETECCGDNIDQIVIEI